MFLRRLDAVQSLQTPLSSTSNPPPLARRNSNPPQSTIEGSVTENDFDLGVTLGTGSFGRVRFATHKGESD